MMKVVAIIQARMGSTRLPGKMLLDLCGKPTIWHVVDRVRVATTINDVWLATTNSQSDEQLYNWAQENNVKCYRGSEEDVLDRYYQTALLAKADVIVRITGDCPLHDGAVIDKVVSEYIASQPQVDYVSNVHPPTFPDGLDMEVFSFNALEKAWKEAKLVSEREHVTPYIWKNPDIFKMRNISNDNDLSNLRLTLDTQEDLDLIRLIIGECQNKNKHCGLSEILDIIDTHPDWLNINNQHQRDEGYAKSLKQDIVS